jgi:hypothetical protein
LFKKHFYCYNALKKNFKMPHMQLLVQNINGVLANAKRNKHGGQYRAIKFGESKLSNCET